MLGHSQKETLLSSAIAGTVQTRMSYMDMGTADYREILVIL